MLGLMMISFITKAEVGVEVRSERGEWARVALLSKVAWEALGPGGIE